MKLLHISYFVIISLLLLLGVGCEPTAQSPDDNKDNDGFTVTINADQQPGHGQYYRKVESSDPVSITISVNSEFPVNEFTITKTADVEIDSSFGTNGMKTIEASGSEFEYQFNYTPTVNDIDALVGFTFSAVNEQGEAEQSDLTLNVTLSPEDNMTRVKWVLTSIIHVNEGNEEVIEDCNEGYAYFFNEDGTMRKTYGDQACGLDGLREYDEWYFTDNQANITLISHNVFTPDTPITESYSVETFTTEELALEQTIDLSDLGQGIETFLYTYEAVPQ